MRIGIVTTWFERGAAYVSRAYAQTLAPKHEVFIYARAGEKYAQGDPRWDGPNVTWGKRVADRVDTFIDWADFKDWIARRGIEAILFNEQQSWEVVVRLRRECVIPIGAYIDYYTRESVPFFQLYDFLLCNTRRHYSVFQDHPHCYYIPWGTDVSVFRPDAEVHGRVQSTLGVRFFHSCGMDAHRKGTLPLFRAFTQLRGAAQLIVHSQGPPAAELQEILVQAPNIEWIQADVGPPGLYHRGDVYVYPARLDGIGLTVAEALACACPVITTDAAPMNEFVQHEINGRLVRVREERRREDGYYWPESLCDPQSLIEAMQWYVDHRDQLPALRDAARRYAQEHLDWKRNSQHLPSLFAQLGQNRVRVSEELMRAALRYEYGRYGGALRYGLVKLGARRAKHFALGLLRRP